MTAPALARAIAVARLRGIDAAYALFCPNPCCTDRRTL